MGYRGYIDLSGDMGPAIKKGGLVIIKRVGPNDIRVGDIIAYGPDARTERVIETVNSNGSVAFITKSDASEGVTSRPVPAGEVTGRFVCSFNALGSVMLALRNPVVIWLCVAGVFAVIIAYDIFSAWVKKRLRRRKMKQLNAAAVNFSALN